MENKKISLKLNELEEELERLKVLSSKNKLSAGENITIENNVISASASESCNCQNDIANLQSDYSNVLNRVAVLETKIDNNSIQYQETIVNEYDVYEREFDISKQNSLTTPSVLFSTESILTSLDENDEIITHSVKVVNNIELRAIFNTAGTYGYTIYDNSVSLKTGTIEVVNNEVSTEKTISLKTTDYMNRTDHNYYITITGSGRQITLKYLKMLIISPNVCVFNNIPAIDVDFNYHTGKYYFSDCSSGTAKICEISPNDLHSTSDIVWTDTGIPAQNYKVYYIGLTNNTTTDLGKKYAIITQKNNTVNILDLDTNQYLYTFDEGTYKVEKVCTKRDYSMLYCEKVNGNSTEIKYCLLYQDGTISFTNISNGNNIADFNTIRNYNNYLTYSGSYFGFATINKNSSVGYYLNQSYNSQSQLKYANKLNLYMHRVIDGSNFEYDLYIKIANKFYHSFITNYNAVVTFSQLSEIGEYDNYFPGLNNDYFTIKNNILTYVKNT